MENNLKIGEIYWADLSVSDDCVQYGRRPVCILGNKSACKNSPIVSVVPISAKLNKATSIPTHVLLDDVLKKGSILLPEQIRCINKSALLGKPIAKLNDEKLAEVTSAIIQQFGLKV